MMNTRMVSLERQRSELLAPARLISQLKMKWPPLLALLGVGVLMTLATIYHYAIYLPQPNQPHRLTALDDVFALGVVLLLGLVGLGLGRRALRLFNVQAFSQVERGVLALGLGWGLLSLGTDRKSVV